MARSRPPAGNGGEEQVPPAIDDFLRRVVQGSLMRHDVLRFFFQNPYAILTISDLSVWMSREERPLGEALQQLAVLGYLGQSSASSAYVLTSDYRKRAAIEEVFGYLEEHPSVARSIRAHLRRSVEAE
ncbi:MAG: hypothetical protein HY331_12210 [Chloroflexi bacterium]|nr:hypothetical protein [Chloroflexota bacterium]